MRISLIITFLIFFKATFGQSCLSEIDSIFRNSDTTYFEKEALKLPDTCKVSNWYFFYLAKSYFFEGNINHLEVTTNKLIARFTQNEGDYITGSRIRILCFLLIEEFRRTKNKSKFKSWVNNFYRIKQDYKCGNPYNGRVNKTLYFMELRFKRLGETENLEYYQKKRARNSRSNRIKKRFLQY